MMRCKEALERIKEHVAQEEDIKIIEEAIEILELFRKHTERNGEDLLMILSSHKYYRDECLKMVKWLERERIYELKTSKGEKNGK